jgi:hypothetical protein
MSTTFKIFLVLVTLFLIVNYAFASSKNSTKYNNPFNIRATKYNYKGEITTTEKYEKFKSIPYGVAAWLRLIRDNYIDKGFVTIETILYRYAPPSENDTEKYIAFVSRRTAIPRDKQIKITNMVTAYQLAKAFAFYESSYILSYSDFQKGWLLFNSLYR